MAYIHSISRLLLSLGLIILIFNSSIHAQENFDNFIEGGSSDATAIYQSYSSPLFSALNFAFSRGWYKTAKAHKPLGFDFSVNVSIAFVPDKDLFFPASEVTNRWIANGDNTRFTGNATEYPTMVGPQDPKPIIEVRNPTTGQFETTGVFVGPVGFDYANDLIPKAAPVAVPQFGIGLIKNTDLKFRFLPSVGSNDVKLKMFGIGLMHDIKQWIPGNSLIPIDISLMVAYSNIDFEVLNIDNVPGNEAIFDLTGWTYNLLVSKELHIITFYGGLSYINSTNTIDVVGEYDVEASIVPITDPVNIEFSNSGFGGTLGFRIKLAVLTINTEYTLREYNTLSFGLGISLR